MQGDGNMNDRNMNEPQQAAQGKNIKNLLMTVTPKNWSL